MDKNKNSSKIVLLMLPYWSPLIPPHGLAIIKSSLENRGNIVKCYDFNIDPAFKTIYNSFYEFLKSIMSEDNRGHLYHTGNDVLRLIMTACYNCKDNSLLEITIRSVIEKNYYISIDNDSYVYLISLMKEYYYNLQIKIEKTISNEIPDYVGISTYIGNIGSSLFAFELIKKINPKITTIMGGGMFTWRFDLSSDYDYFLKNTPFIDKIIMGHGEQILVEIVEGRLQHSDKFLNSKNYDIANLNNLLLPDYSDFEIDKYQFIPTLNSIGCPNKCKFCTEPSYNGKYKSRIVDNTIAEIRYLYEKYQNQVFYLNDSLVNLFINEFATKILEINLPIFYDAFIRIDKLILEIDNVILWRNSGMYRARIGVESGSQRVLDLMNKGIKTKDIKNSIINLAELGIKTSLYLIVGYPNETKDDFNETLLFLDEMKEYIYSIDFNPFRYYYHGQTASDEWARFRKPVYDESIKEQIITQSWELDIYPDSTVRFQRCNELVKFCKSIDLPIPYSSYEIYKADLRWKKIQKYAVPTLVEIKSRRIENIKVDYKKYDSIVNDLNIGFEDFKF